MGADSEHDPVPDLPSGDPRGRPVEAGSAELVVIVAAKDEADRIESTLEALSEAFPTASLWVADDGSRDETVAIAERTGASVVTRDRAVGKGGNVTACARQALVIKIEFERLLVLFEKMKARAG